MSHPFPRRIAPAVALSIVAVVVAYLQSASPLVNEFAATSQPVLAPLQTKEGNVIAEERSPPAAAAPVAPSQTVRTQLPANESEDQVMAEGRDLPAAVAANFPRADRARDVRVEAPYTSVRVNPDREKVRVRAPFVDLDIRW
jgi:hypothetical protein